MNSEITQWNTHYSFNINRPQKECIPDVDFSVLFLFLRTGYKQTENKSGKLESNNDTDNFSYSDDWLPVKRFPADTIRWNVEI